MPFTVSHAAAAVPIARGRLALSALIIGSMAPDFAYFIHWRGDRDVGHTMPGIFLFCLPASLLVLWVFQTFLKYPLISLFPMSHQKRLLPAARGFRFGPLRRFLWLLASLQIGIYTHIMWDSFTHSHGWMVQHLPVLRTVVIPQISDGFSLYTLLQHGSTLVGLLMLALWYIRWLRRAPYWPVTRPPLPVAVRTAAVFFMVFSALTLGALYGFLRVPHIHGLESLRIFVSSVAVNTITTLAVELLVYGALWHATWSNAPARWR